MKEGHSAGEITCAKHITIGLCTLCDSQEMVHEPLFTLILPMCQVIHL